MGKTLIIILTVCTQGVCQYQKQNISDEQKQLKLSLSIGPSWESTLMNFFNFKYIDTFGKICVPFNYERNIQGFGVSPSISLLYNPFKIGIDYTANVRYDYIHHVSSSRKEIYEVITNHFVSVSKALPNRRNINKPNHLAGIGYGIINTNKSFIFNNTCTMNPEERFNLQFPVCAIFYRLPVGRHFYVEPKVNITLKGHPVNKDSQYIFYGLRIAYSTD